MFFSKPVIVLKHLKMKNLGSDCKDPLAPWVYQVEAPSLCGLYDSHSDAPTPLSSPH